MNKVTKEIIGIMAAISIGVSGCAQTVQTKSDSKTQQESDNDVLKSYLQKQDSWYKTSSSYKRSNPSPTEIWRTVRYKNSIKTYYNGSLYSITYFKGSEVITHYYQ